MLSKCEEMIGLHLLCKSDPLQRSNLEVDEISLSRGSAGDTELIKGAEI